MNEIEFELSPWEAFLQSQKPDSEISALTFLSLKESEDDDSVEEAFLDLIERHLRVNIDSLPKLSMSGQLADRLVLEDKLVKSSMLVSDLDENDPLRLYLEELSATPAIGEETQYALRVASGDQRAAETLTRLGLSRVIELAKMYTGRGVLLLDLIQEGSIGLWQAIQNLPQEDYTSHRDYYIRSALDKAVILQSRNSGLLHKMRQTLQDYRNADERLLTELGRNPALEEIAEAIHISLEEAETVKKMMDNAVLLAQAEQAAAPHEETQEDEQAVEDTAYFQMRQRISELLSQLSEEDAKLLTLRYGLEKGLPMSPEETSCLLRIPVSEIMSREAAALALLRKNM